jgi:hypothetical protein
MRMNPDISARGPEPEHPRSEPEILPPRGRSSEWHSADGRTHEYVFMDRHGQAHRVEVKTPGPLTAIFVLVAIALVAGVIFAVVIGVLALLVPIAAIALASLIAFAYARGFWHRLRGRM